MITAVFTSGFDHTEVSGLWQWDYGQKLRIQGLNLPPAVEIHFSLSKSGGDSESRVGVTKDGVTDVPIPDSMLENGGTIQNYYIYAFIYITNETSGKTVKWVQLHVNSRPKPEAFDSPEEKELFKEAIAAVNESAGRAETAEKSAEAWAHGHDDYPERYEDNAKFYSDKAREKAEETASNLQKVSNLANQVKENAETVASDKNAVEEFKNKAGESAENAAVSESNAALHENNAKEAQTKAETAQRIAEEAKEQVAKDKEEVLLAKNAVKESEKNVTENKEYVRQTVENFTSLAENAVDDVNVAGQNQVNNIEKAGQAALDNISTGVDETLTQSGKAADAKVTGEKFTGLEHDVEELNNKKITKFYASNLGNTNLQDSDSGKITDVMLYGKSEQKRYSGKNLLKSTLVTTTANGVTCTNNGDGTYTLNGTATDQTDFHIITSLPKESNKYKIIGCPSGGGSSNYKIILVDDIYWERQIDIGNGVIYNGEYNLIRLSIRIANGTNLKNIVFKPMIVDVSLYPDATYDDFEPYVGGIPSPNPDYPQEIKSVVNPVVKVCGKNLLDVSKATFQVGKAKLVDGEIYLNGTFDSNYDYYFFDAGNVALDLILKVNKTVTISCGSFNIGIRKKSGTETGKSIKINPIADRLISIYLVVPSGTYENVKVPIMVEIGDTVTDYEPYKGQTAILPYTLNAIPVSSGGNVTIDGQQYIADYVDVENKKLIKWIEERTITRVSVGNYADYENGSLKRAVSDFPNANYSIKSVMSNAFRTIDSGYALNACRMYKNDTLFIFVNAETYPTAEDFNNYLAKNTVIARFILKTPTEIDLTDEEVKSFKELATYYPHTNVTVKSEQLDGYTTFNYPISLANGWNYVKEQLGDTREFIYDMELQSAEAYVNSEYAVAIAELEV